MEDPDQPNQPPYKKQQRYNTHSQSGVHPRHSPPDLEDLSPEQAVSEYLEYRKFDSAQSTVQNLRYRLKQFIIWAKKHEVTTMAEISGRKAERFKQWRIQECGLNPVTLEQHIRQFRLFIEWCEANDLVRVGTADKIIIPNVSDKEAVRDTKVDYETGETIVDHLARFEWATSRHIIFHLLWHTGMRRSALRALDVEDWHLLEDREGAESEHGILTVRNRPETGTPIKKREDGERNITVTKRRLADALKDYIAQNRHDVSDEHGRNPLITTSHGRMHTNTIARNVYQVTRPCFYSGECPHDRDIETCEATENSGYSKCPSSVSPHAIRRGAITAHLSRHVPMEVASERMAVSVDTLKLHYDARDKEEMRSNRSQYLGNL